MLAQIRPVAALLTGALFMQIGIGLTMMLIPLRATGEGWSNVTLGWIGAVYAASFTIGCLVTPRLVRRVGHIRVYAAIQSLLVASLLLHSLVVHPLAWALFRFVAGLAVAGTYMVLESWLNEKVTNQTRGTMLSAYMITCMAGIAGGQYIAPLGDPMSPTLFVVAGLLFVAAALPVTLSTAQSPQPLTQVGIDLRGLFRNSPAAMVGSFMSGVVFSIWSYFAPVYGKLSALSDLSIATMLSMAMIGGSLAQLPIGRLSDRMDRRIVMAGAGAFGAALCLLAHLVSPAEPWVLFAFTFTLGLVLFPIYGLANSHANDFAEPQDFVKVSGGLLITYGVGTIIGPLIAGPVIDGMGRAGFFLTLGGAFALYGGYSYWRSLRRDPVAAADRCDYQPAAPAVAQTPESLQLDPRIEDVPQKDRLTGG